jgi:membrane protein YdbS with pleckstrin-like domain
LLPREVCVATVRRHPAVLIASSGQAVGGLLVAAVLWATLLRDHRQLAYILWALWAILFLRLVWRIVNWAVDYFVITSERILLTSGVFTRSVAMMPLAKVTDMSFHRTLAGRLLGYGEFVVESAGQDQALRKIDHIPYPEQLYLVVCGRIFKDAAGQDDGTGDVQPARSPAPAGAPPPGPQPGTSQWVEVIDTEVPGATVDADGAADIVDAEVIEDEDVVEGEVIEADEMTDEDAPEGGAPGADDTQEFGGGNRRTGER